MRAKKTTCSLAISTLSLVAVLPFLGTQEVQAFPADAIGTGTSCRTCHGTVGGGRNPVPGLMDVTGVRVVNLGTQLSGAIRGPVATFDAVAGTNVTISMDVVSLANLTENPIYSLQLKRLEFTGQKNSLTNVFGWSDANPPGSGWVKYQSNSPPHKPYFTKDLASGETGNFTFDLGLSTNTPVDFYDLEFAIAGVDGPSGARTLFYSDEHFYVAVVSPTLFTDGAVTFSAALANAGYIVEVATDVNGPWSTYTGAMGSIEGSNVVLMKNSSGPRKYFRLRKL